MGLDVSHDAFSAAYSAFNRFRQEIGRACGVDFPPHYEFEADGRLKERGGRVVYKAGLDNDMIYFPDEMSPENAPGLREFFIHSDCDGYISPEMCVKVADELEALIPKVEALNSPDGGHIGRDGGYVAVLKKFIAGCRKAAAANEPLEFS